MRQVIRTKAGQYTWLQVLALAISFVAYLLNSMTVALAMLLVATVFGALSTMQRIRQAKQQMRQPGRNQPRR